MQALVATRGCVPDNRVVCSVRCGDPGRAAAILILTPGEHDRRRICGGNFVCPDRAGVIVKSEICSLAGVISNSGNASVSS